MSKKLNLKIYGIATVGSKGQVIIPKECREDFGIQIGEDFDIVMVDKKAFGIGKNNLKNLQTTGHLQPELEQFGYVQIGTKFQFVIPCEIRKELSIQSKDNLIVVGRQKGNKKEGLGFIKNDNIQYLLDFIKNYAENFNH